MEQDSDRPPELCTCLALRQAARHVSQFYDRALAGSGLRTTQFSILARLRRGPSSIGDLAATLVMDRTTLGRAVRPLEREGLVAIRPGTDPRSRELRLTAAGRARLQAASPAWSAAQSRFDAVFGSDRARALRGLMRAVTDADFTRRRPRRVPARA